MSLYHAVGIVLANRDMGEADRIVTLLCREQGKLEAVARGARRPRNRLVGLTLPFNVLKLSLFSGKGLDSISQAEGARAFQKLRDDLDKMAYAAYLSELTAEFLPEREPCEPVFLLLLRCLAALETGREPETLSRFYELRLLDLAGFRPSLETCLHCGRAAAGESLFSPADGGLYCPACAGSAAGMIRLDGRIITAMTKCLQGDARPLAALPEAARRIVKRALREFIEARLDKRLKSLNFLTGIMET